MDKDFIVNTASTIWSQIKGTTHFAVLASWGVSKLFHWYNPKLGMAGLVMKVNGRLYQGLLFIAYNEGHDFYELYKLDGAECELIQYDIMFDELGTVIDRNVENPSGTFKYQAG